MKAENIRKMERIIEMVTAVQDQLRLVETATDEIEPEDPLGWPATPFRESITDAIHDLDSALTRMREQFPDEDGAT